MLEHILSYIAGLDPSWVYVILFFFSVIENIFPPSPSDLVVVIGSTVIAKSSVGFSTVLLVTGIGSALGFIAMFFVGKYFGEKVIRAGRLKFISQKSLEKADKWFHKYGYSIIVVNRFLPGTRSVISFFSGVHKLKLGKTFLAAAASAFLWNAFIIYLGMQVGQNVKLIDHYLKNYSHIFGIITIVVILIVVIRYFFKKKKTEAE